MKLLLHQKVSKLRSLSASWTLTYVLFIVVNVLRNYWYVVWIDPLLPVIKHKSKWNQQNTGTFNAAFLFQDNILINCVLIRHYSKANSASFSPSLYTQYVVFYLFCFSFCISQSQSASRSLDVGLILVAWLVAFLRAGVQPAFWGKLAKIEFTHKRQRARFCFRAAATPADPVASSTS